VEMLLEETNSLEEEDPSIFSCKVELIDQEQNVVSEDFIQVYVY
jgi:hypothetical protein